MGMFSLKDWTTYVYAGMVVAVGLGILAYECNFDVYKTDDTNDKQFNDPELKMGTWRLGRLPSRGAPLETGLFVVFRMRGAERSLVSRIVAVEGQKVEVRADEVLVDGQAIPAPKGAGKSRFDVPEIVVPRGCVFCVNDLRAKGASAECDSRRFGPIPIEAITHCFKPLKDKS